MKRSLILSGLLLAACNSEPAGENGGTGLAEDYNEMLDEAAAVEDKAEVAKQRLDAALDEADGKARD